MQRRYPFLLTILLLLSTQLVIADDVSAKATSKTYFSVRPQFQFGSPEQLSFVRDIRARRKEGYNFGLRATVFGGQSTNRDDMGRYFMPFGEPCATVDGTIAEGGNDIMPQNFNIFSVKYSDFVAANLPVDNINKAFRSKITLQPRQSVIGLGLSYDQQFTIRDYTLWFLASAPITRVKNTTGFCECILEEGEFYEVTPISGETTNLNTEIKNMQQAFAQEQWCFGKIDCKSRTKTRLAFLELILGIEWLKHEKCSIDSYFGVTIPTGNKPKGEYVFEPIVGNGGHFGLIWGNALGMDLHYSEAHNLDIRLEANLTGQYLFARKQTRSMDLKNKPWSRYIEIYADKAQATQANNLFLADNINAQFLATPGINTLTQDVKVTPGFNVSLNLAITLLQKEDERGFSGELGYNFYAKEAEKVCLDCCKLGTAAIKDHFGAGIVNTARDITNDQLKNEAGFLNALSNTGLNANILDNYDNRVLTSNDLDLQSATHPCVISHTIYGALGYHWDDIEYPIVAGLGTSYEFDGHMNTALNRWLLWGTLGLSF